MIDEESGEKAEEEELEEHNQPDFDKRSVISNKTIKSLVSKKKDKIKLKRQFLLKRKLSNSSQTTLNHAILESSSVVAPDLTGENHV